MASAAASAAEQASVRALRLIRAELPLATPVKTSSTLDRLHGGSTRRRFYFKCENLQKTGAFKARGALNAVLSLPAADATRGVCTHSSGNHGMALAFAAQRRGVPCTVVVPKDTPQAKVDAIRGYGATVQFCEYSQRQAQCEAFARSSGARIIHPYDDTLIMAGQGTIAVELLEQVPDLDAIVVPVSGGGLIGGIAAAAKALKPTIRIFGVEPKGKDLAKSLELHERRLTESLEPLDTVADAIRTKALGAEPWRVVHDDQAVERTVFAVSNDQIRAAMRFSFQRMKLVVEPAGAAALAAVLSGQLDETFAREEYAAIRHVGLVVCGGNVDIDKLSSFL